jgi:hypothetical protein
VAKLTDRPFGCPRCFPPDAAAACEAAHELSVVAELVEQSHLSIRVRSCPSCGQRFVWVFSEMIDWVDGNDPQRCTLVPISPAEAEHIVAQGENVSEASIESLSDGRPVLVMDFPKSGEKASAYIPRARIIGPHD